MSRIADVLARIKSVISRSDSEWKESDHPRGEDGKFGSKGGGKSASEKPTKAKKSVSLSSAIKNKPSQAERSWHEKTDAWKTASPMLMGAIANTKGLSNVSIDPGTVSFYQRGKHSVHMGYSLSSPDNKTVLVWRHEFGHAMDFNGSTESQSIKCKTMMDYDSKDKTRILNAYIPFLKENLNDDEWVGGKGLFLSDFVAALTKGEEGYGHSNEYFEKDESRLAEMFANYVTLICDEEGEKYQTAMRKIAPATCLAFDGILMDMANPKRYKKTDKE